MYKKKRKKNAVREKKKYVQKILPKVLKYKDFRGEREREKEKNKSLFHMNNNFLTQN